MPAMNNKTLELKLLRTAVEWITAEQPKWWDNMDDEECIRFVKSIMSYDFSEDIEKKAYEFKGTEIVLNTYLNWFDALPETFSLLSEGVNIAKSIPSNN